MRFNGSVTVLPDLPALTRFAADAFMSRASEAIRLRRRFTVALAGGSTPKSLYALLAREASELPWQGIHCFWGDERHAPPDLVDSNYRMAQETLLSKVAIASQNIHRIPAELADAELAASRYEQELREFFELRPAQRPRFDLVLLGMGADGHTASLFPGSSALKEQTRLVAAPWVQKFSSHRITLTVPVFNQAACVIFLVSGAEKAETLRAVLEETQQPDRWPCRMIQPSQGTLLWLVDRAAGSLLRTRKPNPTGLEQ
jgi:6-phosphogluconolactonase